MTALFIATRALHIGACLLFLAIFAFDRFAVQVASSPSEISDYWRARLRSFTTALLPLILCSGILWFVLVTMAMSGQAPQFETLQTVWARTQFGTVCKVRLMIWLGTVVLASLQFSKSYPRIKNSAAAVQFILSGCLAGSLAWTGHGRENSPWHLLADIFHLLAAGFWPAGLLPLALVLNKMRRSSAPADRAAMAALVQRFSAISLGAVAMIAATGLVNSWFLLGSPSHLFDQPYGRWLLLKIFLFGIAVSIGAVNLLRLKPRLISQHQPSSSTDSVAAQLQFNVLAELILGAAIILAVAVLGILPP